MHLCPSIKVSSKDNVDKAAAMMAVLKINSFFNVNQVYKVLSRLFLLVLSKY